MAGKHPAVHLLVMLPCICMFTLCAMHVFLLVAMCCAGACQLIAGRSMPAPVMCLLSYF